MFAPTIDSPRVELFARLTTIGELIIGRDESISETVTSRWQNATLSKLAPRRGERQYRVAPQFFWQSYIFLDGIPKSFPVSFGSHLVDQTQG